MRSQECIICPPPPPPQGSRALALSLASSVFPRGGTAVGRCLTHVPTTVAQHIPPSKITPFELAAPSGKGAFRKPWPTFWRRSAANSPETPPHRWPGRASAGVGESKPGPLCGFPWGKNVSFTCEHGNGGRVTLKINVLLKGPPVRCHVRGKEVVVYANGKDLKDKRKRGITIFA